MSAIVIQEKAQERLRENLIVWLSSVRPDGRPHIVPVWYLWESPNSVLIFSKPNNQKLRNIAQNPQVALALDDTDEGGDVVMLDGTAELLPVGAANASIPAYVEKYRNGIREIGMTPEQFFSAYSEPIRISVTRILSYS